MYKLWLFLSCFLLCFSELYAQQNFETASTQSELSQFISQRGQSIRVEKAVLGHIDNVAFLLIRARNLDDKTQKWGVRLDNDYENFMQVIDSSEIDKVVQWLEMVQQVIKEKAVKREGVFLFQTKSGVALKAFVNWRRYAQAWDWKIYVEPIWSADEQKISLRLAERDLDKFVYLLRLAQEKITKL